MDKKVRDNILYRTDVYYSEKLRQHGATNWGVDWNSVESQETRFIQLSKLFEGEENFSVCDYGCGWGYYFEFLGRNESGKDFQYFGVDVSAGMIEKAKELYGNFANAHFARGDEIGQAHDYIVASGIFNVLGGGTRDTWREYMLETVQMFDRYSRKGFAFNCLTKYSDADKMRADLYYADPLFWFDYAKRNFSRNVALLHDYKLWEFTLLVRK